MRKNKYNELSSTIMLIIGLICIVFGTVVQFLLKDTSSVLNYTITYVGKYMIFAGIVCSLLSIITKIARISRDNTIANLKSSGKLVYATNLKVWKNYYWGVDRKHWCHLLGEWEEPITHQKYEFRSDKLWVDIEPIITDKKIEKIPVYIDNKNPKIYFVDVDELTPTSTSDKKNKKSIVGNVILIIVTVIVLSTLGIFACLKLVPSTSVPNNGNIDNEQILNNDISDNETIQNEIDDNVDEEQDETIPNDCEPFICFDDVSHIESEDLISKANKIDERLRRVLTLISLDNSKEGLLTLNDVDKFKLHSLIINNFIEEDKYLLLENGLDQSTVSASDYEKVFTEITGIENVKEFFKGYDLKTEKDANQSVYYEENGKTYYIVPFGIGMEIGLSVISDVNEKAEKTELVVKTYDVDYENDKYTHIKTTTFEIQTNGLRVYNFKVEK